ncbi:MAG TPA: SulP family inorganic anion transporter [Casimicrobiaceae bacterium]|nr:SulP family inorganic anion transporter [Casimicrobiaceae bacterium]
MSPAARMALPFLAWRDRVTRASLLDDLAAGVTGALVVLPQAVAFATLAGLPPQYGLYCAIVPAIVAALWGSSWHLVCGPTSTLALVVLATVAPLAAPRSGEYVSLVLTLALIVGLMQLAMGAAQLGRLVDFISHTVMLGFTAGAGLLIIAAQLPGFFGIADGGTHFFQSMHAFLRNVWNADPWITATGAVTLVVAVIARQTLHRIPYMIVAMAAGSAFAYVLAHSELARVPTVGALPPGLHLLSVPSFDLDVWRELVPAALALTMLGLTEAVSIARGIAQKSGQRIDASRECVGQGLSNIVGAFASAYPSSGSLDRSDVNFDAGARTPLAAVVSSLVLAATVLAVAPLAAYLPMSATAAVLLVVGWSLVDVREMRRVARTSRGDLAVFAVTFVATLTIALEAAIFVGVLASLLAYLNRTTRPSLARVAPDAHTPQRRFQTAGADAPLCPQLDILRLDGSLFFGAVEHVRDELEAARRERPNATHVLLVCSGVDFIDSAGGECLVQASRYLRDSGATLYLTNLKPGARAALEHGGFLEEIGPARVWPTKAQAIRALYKRFDVPVCEACRARIFTECHLALPNGMPRAVPVRVSP